MISHFKGTTVYTLTSDITHWDILRRDESIRATHLCWSTYSLSITIPKTDHVSRWFLDTITGNDFSSYKCLQKWRKRNQADTRKNQQWNRLSVVAFWLSWHFSVHWSNLRLTHRPDTLGVSFSVRNHDHFISHGNIRHNLEKYPIFVITLSVLRLTVVWVPRSATSLHEPLPPPQGLLVTDQVRFLFILLMDISNDSENVRITSYSLVLSIHLLCWQQHVTSVSIVVRAYRYCHVYLLHLRHCQYETGGLQTRFGSSSYINM